MLRSIGFLLLLVSVALLGWNLFDYFVNGRFEPMLVGQLWFQLHSDSLQLTQPAVERYLSPALWHSFIAPFLNFWVFLVTLATSFVCLIPLWFRTG